MALRPLSLRVRPAVGALVLCVACATLAPAAGKSATTAGVIPPQARYRGMSYAEWAAAWSEWFVGFPLDQSPAVDPDYDVRNRQSGNVWFLASPFGSSEKHITIRTGVSLFFGLLSAEASNLEAEPFFGATEQQQREAAAFLADHIGDLSASVDGVEVGNLQDYRVSSPQYDFTAPSPWVFGDVGGTGTAVVDGYFLMLAPLSRGEHTLHIAGAFHFSTDEGDPFDLDLPIDVTFHITVSPGAK
jgi:hypothetical protein